MTADDIRLGGPSRVQWLVRILHPRLFPEPLGPGVKDLHTRYYHRTPTAAQVRTLLERAGIAQ